MNYRHSFHAGNPADVMKHAALARVLAYLNKKENAYRVLDTHAGAGLYDLDGANAQRTLEADSGIEAVLAADLAGTLPKPAAALLAPYLDAVRATRAGGRRLYPGSPALALALSRPQDRFLFCELHKEERAKLEKRVGEDPRVKILPQDGWWTRRSRSRASSSAWWRGWRPPTSALPPASSCCGIPSRT